MVEVDKKEEEEAVLVLLLFVHCIGTRMIYCDKKIKKLLFVIINKNDN